MIFFSNIQPHDCNYTLVEKELDSARNHSEGYAQLFDLLPDVFLFVKDRKHRFVRGNKALLQMLGLENEEQLVGFCDLDFSPTLLAHKYIEEDRKVMTSKKALLNQVWLVAGKGSAPRWYTCSKIPLLDSKQQCIGLAGFLRYYDHEVETLPAYQKMLPVLQYAEKYFAHGASVAEMAKKSACSENQFRRNFFKIFRMQPQHYLQRLKIEAACKLLRDSKLGLGQIAIDCGFYDQSTFTRYFKKVMNLTPLAYRKRFSAS